MRTALEVVRSQEILVVAHRGNSSEAPENTLPAFESAIAAGARLIEPDYHHSADGVPIVSHDPTLEHRTNAVQLWNAPKPVIAEHTAAELATLDAGSWFSPDFAGTRLPTLEQALTVISPRATPVLERKAGDAATLVELLTRMNLVEQCVLMAFDWLFLAQCHQLAPQLVLGALGENDCTPMRIKRAKATGAAFMGWNQIHLTEASIRAIHQQGLRAWTWTVDDRARAEQLCAWKIDAITSNRPRDMLRWVAEFSGKVR